MPLSFRNTRRVWLRNNDASVQGRKAQSFQGSSQNMVCHSEPRRAAGMQIGSDRRLDEHGEFKGNAIHLGAPDRLP